MSFGWSAGDIVLAIKFLVEIGAALREVDGAKTEFQEAAGSLAGLEMTLQFLEQQEQAADTQRRAVLHGNLVSVGSDYCNYTVLGLASGCATASKSFVLESEQNLHISSVTSLS